jgi:uncharacterized membrane protein (UPF0127 family)
MSVLAVRPPGRPEVAVSVAESPLDRLFGLAGLRRPAPGTGLLIPRCRSVHTLGMRFRLDVLFVTIERGLVLVHDEHHGVPPGRLVRASAEARGRRGLAALELPA